MKKAISYLFLFVLLVACQTENQSIEIGSYTFLFPSHFKKRKMQGTDSNVSIIKSGEIVISADYGYYSNSFKFYEKDMESFYLAEIGPHEIIIDTLENEVQRKILIAENPEMGTTGVYLKDLNDFNPTMNGYKALSMTVSKISIEDQNRVLEIFRSGKKLAE